VTLIYTQPGFPGGQYACLFGPASRTLVSGTLPPGLTLRHITQAGADFTILTGKPTTAGDYNPIAFSDTSDTFGIYVATNQTQAGPAPDSTEVASWAFSGPGRLAGISPVWYGTSVDLGGSISENYADLVQDFWDYLTAHALDTGPYSLTGIDMVDHTGTLVSDHNGLTLSGASISGSPLRPSAAFANLTYDAGITGTDYAADFPAPISTGHSDYFVRIHSTGHSGTDHVFFVRVLVFGGGGHVFNDFE
jgi:hypothetical protein